MTVSIPIWLAALAVLAIVLQIVVLHSLKRRRRARLALSDGAGMDELLRTVAGLTQSSVLPGNRIELIENGAFFDRVLADIDAAEKTVHVEAFLAKEGETTRRLTTSLVRQARAGRKVRLLLDAAGGKNFGKEGLRQLKEAGVFVCFYHRFRLRTLGLINNRDHRKIVVVDGRIGYVGGHCWVDTWLGEAQDKKHNRDITARVEGPVVAQLQSAFCDNWIEEDGVAPGGEPCYPELEEVGDALAHAVWVSPAGAPSCVELLHYLAIRAACERITIQNPYFLPDPDLRQAMAEAVERGVRIRVMVPATTASDAPHVQHASHHHYGTLLGAGVEIYEYQRTLLHQKVLTVDGCWSAVGSTNFDDRSFEINDEVSLAVFSEETAARLEEIFEADLQHCKRVELADWRRRGPLHRLKDFTAFLVNEQL